MNSPKATYLLGHQLTQLEQAASSSESKVLHSPQAESSKVPYESSGLFSSLQTRNWRHDLLVKFGLASRTDVPFELLRKLWLEAEAVGFDSAWLSDHLYAYSPVLRAGILNPAEDVLECWTALSALAAVTSRIRIGSMVLCNPLRHPPLLAKMCATLDVISHGRLNVGIGSGDYLEKEYTAYGIPYSPKTRERIEQLKESIKILKIMWTEDEPTFRGRYYAIEGATCNPKPIQKPHPPLWVGIWTGRRIMPRLAADLADAVNFTHNPPSACAEKIKLIEKFLRKGRRSNKALIRSWRGYVTLAETQKELNQSLAESARIQRINIEELLKEEHTRAAIIGTPEKCVEKFREYMAAGINYFILIFQAPDKLDAVRLFSRTVMPALAEDA